MVNKGSKRAILLLLIGATLLFMANVAIAHKSFSSEEEEEKAAAEFAASSKAEDGAEVEDKDDSMSELDRNIAAQQALSAQKFDPVKLAQKYVMESCFMAFFVVCFVILFLGKRHNALLAELWHEKSLPLIREQFAYVGMEDGRDKVGIE